MDDPLFNSGDLRLALEAQMEKLRAAVEAEPEDSLKQAHARPPANVGGAPRPPRPREHGAGLV